jgi:hypothetical protein
VSQPSVNRAVQRPVKKVTVDPAIEKLATEHLQSGAGRLAPGDVAVPLELPSARRRGDASASSPPAAEA